MLQRVMLDGIELPRLYIAENLEDVEIAKDKGIPFVRWSLGNDALVRMLLRPTLEKLFPYIKWNSVLGPKRRFKTKVTVYEQHDEDFEGSIDDHVATEATEFDSEAEPEEHPLECKDEETEFEDDDVLVEESDVTTGTRVFEMTEQQTQQCIEKKLSIQDYIGDMSSYVDLDILQRLRIMPAFIGDIMDCIKVNATSGIYWNEGYNKKLGQAVGNFNRSGQLPNLIILDISGSIPRGISATMLTLIDTLRSQLSADLIITSSNSKFYPMGTELPDPQSLRDRFGYGNETYEFVDILAKKIAGKHYGHVISFGDDDTPDYSVFQKHADSYSLMGTKVEHVHHFHTGKSWHCSKEIKTGYAKWCHLLANEPEAEYNTDWCHVIK